MRYALITVSVLTAGIILLEGVLRVTGYPSAYTAMYRPDPVLGYRHVEGTTLQIAVDERIYEVTFDSEGVVDRAGRAAAPVVILGDGVSAGIELPPEYRLAAQIVRRRCAAAAINLSVTGYGPLQQVLLLERWIARHGRPVHVFVIHNLSNDFGESVPVVGGRASEPQLTESGDVVLPMAEREWRRVAARAAKASRIYSLFVALRDNKSLDLTMDQRQRWLFEQSPPSDVALGLRHMQRISNRLAGIAEQHRFSVTVINWIDRGLSPSNDEAVATATDRIRHTMPFTFDNLPSMSASEKWDERWLVAGTRHANASATDQLAARACEQFRAVSSAER